MNVEQSNQDTEAEKTRTKQRSKQSSVPDPAENPFRFLWLVNCIVYSVIIAFYISKGWEKQQGERNQIGRPNWSSKASEQFEAKAQVIREKLSKANAELERLKSNGKIAKKERRIVHS